MSAADLRELAAADPADAPQIAERLLARLRAEQESVSEHTARWRELEIDLRTVREMLGIKRMRADHPQGTYQADVERSKRRSDPATQRAFGDLMEQRRPASRITPVDWDELWGVRLEEPKWAIYPIVPEGRQVALWSVAKQGKSLLALDAAAAAATGRSIFGQAAQEPVTVVYLDQEMTQADLRERLEEMGYSPQDDLSRLVYFQLQSLPPLDSPEGGEIVEDVVKMTGADLVVLDTMARVVAGDENDSDTYRNFYRHTGARLKAMNCALLRLDHGGKNLEQGQRGSSAKVDDVDVVFRLQASDADDGGYTQVQLKRTHSRVSWVRDELLFRRHEDPLRHVLASEPYVEGVKAVAELLERESVDLSLPIAQIRRQIGNRPTRVIAQAVKFLRERQLADDRQRRHQYDEEPL